MVVSASSGYYSFFVKNVVFYFLIKLATSLDDLIWLSPFVIALTAAAADDDASNSGGGSVVVVRERIKVALIYTAICLVVSCEALILAWAAVHGVTLVLNSNGNNENEDDGFAGRVLGVIGGLCIAVLAFFEWRNDSDNDDEADSHATTEKEDDEEEGENARPENIGEYGSVAITPLLLEQGSDKNHSEESDESMTMKQSSSARYRHRRPRRALVNLVVVGFCGTLDTLAVVFSVLMSTSKKPATIGMVVLPVLVGSVLAAVVILAAAFSISLFKPLANCLQRVPLWMLLCVIAVYILVSGLA